MNKMERDMVAAIHSKRRWTRFNNTKVIYIGGELSRVYVYGQHLADVRAGVAIPNEGTFRMNPTKLFCSRLLALGVGASIDPQGQACIDGRPADRRSAEFMEDRKHKKERRKAMRARMRRRSTVSAMAAA